MPTLTIITPTYNREACLRECWESLKRQSCKDFQWLVVDDGSTDNTAKLISDIQKEFSDYSIDYIYKKNGGKHTALNASHPHIRGKYMVVLDSDDIFTFDAVEMILGTWKEYEDNPQVGQVIYLKGFSEDRPICYVKHEKEIVDTLREPRIGIVGRDCCDSYRTELFVKYPFREFPGERFLGEGSAFFFIELEARGVYVNRVIYLCGYRGDGLTVAGRKMRLQNPLGGRYNSMVYMHWYLPFKMRFKKAVLYVCYSRFAELSLKEIITDNNYPVLVSFALLPGWVLSFYWRRKYFP